MTPAFGRPTMPRSIARLATMRTLSVPWAWWVMPMAHARTAFSASQYCRPIRSIVSRSTPDSRTTVSQSTASTLSRHSAKPSVDSAMKALSSAARLRTTFATPVSSARSPPMWGCT